MTNFEKWKAELTAYDVLQLYYEQDCHDCPATNICHNGMGSTCNDSFFEWANQEAT